MPRHCFRKNDTSLYKWYFSYLLKQIVLRFWKPLHFVTGSCTVAICGGVNVLLDPRVFVTLAKTRMLSSDGQCKAFTKDADGYGRGEGCGIVILKKLKEVRNFVFQNILQHWDVELFKIKFRRNYLFLRLLCFPNQPKAFITEK